EVTTPMLRPRLTVTFSPAPVTQSFQDGISPDGTYAGTRDTRLSALNPDTNYGFASSLFAVSDPLVSTLLKWDVSAIPPGSTIQGVSFTVNVTDISTDIFEVYQLKRNWVQGQATWNMATNTTPWEVPGAQGVTDRGSTVLGTVTA